MAVSAFLGGSVMGWLVLMLLAKDSRAWITAALIGMLIAVSFLISAAFETSYGILFAGGSISGAYIHLLVTRVIGYARIYINEPAETD